MIVQGRGWIVLRRVLGDPRWPRARWQFHRLAFETKGAAIAEEFETTAIEPKAAEFEDGRGHASGLAAEV